MDDIWNFLEGLADGLQSALQAKSLFPVLIIGLLIGMFTANSRPALKALIAVILVFAIKMLPGAVNGHFALPPLPDLRHLSSIVELFLMYVFGYGMVAVVGNLKATMKLGGAKAAH